MAVAPCTLCLGGNPESEDGVTVTIYVKIGDGAWTLAPTNQYVAIGATVGYMVTAFDDVDNAIDVEWLSPNWGQILDVDDQDDDGSDGIIYVTGEAYGDGSHIVMANCQYTYAYVNLDIVACYFGEMPKRITPGDDQAVSVDIEPDLTGTGHNVQFSVHQTYGGSSGSGAIAPYSLADDETVTITAGNQTAASDPPGQFKESLYGLAKLDGTSECGISDGFTVCAHPSGLSFNQCSEFKTTTQVPPYLQALGIGTFAVGGFFATAWTSDSGDPDDLDQVEAAEVVSAALDKTGVYEDLEITKGESGWMAVPEKVIDSHVHNNWLATIFLRIDAEGPGHAAFDQVFQFRCKRCGNAPEPVPNSGHLVQFAVSTPGETEVLFETWKSGKAVTVDGVTSGASATPLGFGPDPVVLRE